MKALGVDDLDLPRAGRSYYELNPAALDAIAPPQFRMKLRIALGIVAPTAIVNEQLAPTDEERQAWQTLLACKDLLEDHRQREIWTKYEAAL